MKSPYGCPVRILSSVPSVKDRVGSGKDDGGIWTIPERRMPFSKGTGDIFLLTGPPLMDAKIRTSKDFHVGNGDRNEIRSTVFKKACPDHRFYIACQKTNNIFLDIAYRLSLLLNQMV